MSTTPPLTFPRQHALTRRFTTGVPRNILVTDDGTRVLFLRSKGPDDPVLCLWEWTLDEGVERLVVDPLEIGALDADLPAAERARRERTRESSGGIVAFSTDATASRATFSVGGSLFVVDLASGELTAHDTPPGVFDPRIDPTGRCIAFVIGDDLHVRDLRSDGRPDLVITEIEPTVSWGRAEFIAAEEMGRQRGHWWAPDGSGLIAARVDTADVPVWWIADPAQPATTPTPIRYPAAGTTNATVSLWHIGLDGTRTEIPWSTAAGAVPYEYLADVVWSSDGAPLVVRQTRDQRLVSIAEVELHAAPGAPPAVSEIHRIEDPDWVELMPGSPARCDEGLLTIEDRAELDRRTLCLDGRPLDTPDVQVRGIVAVTDVDAVVTAWTDPTEIHVLRVPFDGGTPTRLTETPGVHGAAASGHLVVISSASPSTPAATFTVSADGQPVATIDSHAATSVLDARPEFVRLGTRGLAAAIFLPSEHDGSPLPVLLDPYGGPHAQRVLKTHTAHLTSQWFAEQGYAVLVVDNRGTPGRGPAFEREVKGDLAAPVLADQLDGLDAAAEMFGFLDLDRVGIRGWSFGGYLAALAALRAPERIHAAIAGAPVTSWRLYDTHYTERYLGHPTNHGGAYDAGDLGLEAAGLERPLLLIHGLADDNVVAAHTLQFSTALLAAGRPHEVLPLSGVTHMTPQEVVAENLLHLQRDFLDRHLRREPAR